MTTITLKPSAQATDVDQAGENDRSFLSTILVGIPCYNEEVAVGSLVLRAAKYADRVVVVDDGSTDKTTEVAHLAGADVIVHDRNEGKGTALRDLFAYALDYGADIIVILDGDGQHNPDDIPKLIEPLELDEADVVNGSRYLDGTRHETPLYRRVGQVVLDKFTNFWLGRDVDISDTQSGFRAFTRKAMPHFRFGSKRLAIDSEMLIDAAHAKLRIMEVGVGVRYDVGRSSKHPVSHGLQVLTGVLRSIELKRPLLAFTLPGAVLLAIGIALGFYVYQVYLFMGRVPNGPAILTLLVVIIGTFMTFTGIILHTMASLTESLEAKH
ncbi:MAG: glycosyltransferase family 2 protein [Halobacteriota archaeon]